MYEIRVSAEVARRGRDGSGSRRRAGLVFSRRPTFLDVVPKEVREDPHLEVREITDDELAAAGGTITPLPQAGGTYEAAPPANQADGRRARRGRRPRNAQDSAAASED